MALLSSAKPLINNTYTIKVLLNGLKSWNAVSVSLQTDLLKKICGIKLLICLEFALKCTLSLIYRKISSPLTYQTFLVHPDLDSCKFDSEK